MLRHGAIVLVALLTSTSGVTAQRRSAPRERSGFWYGFGLAPGWTRVTCRICAGDRHGGISAYVGLGGRTSQAVRIGGELAAWRDRQADVTQTLLSIAAATDWYPGTRRRFYLRGGAALVMHRVSDGTDVITASEIGPQLGAGYDYPFGRKWVIGPFFHYSVGVIGGDVKFNGGQAANTATVSFLQVGVSLTRR